MTTMRHAPDISIFHRLILPLNNHLPSSRLTLLQSRLYMFSHVLLDGFEQETTCRSSKNDQTVVN